MDGWWDGHGSDTVCVAIEIASRRLGGWLAFVGENVGECGAIDGVDGWRKIGWCLILKERS
jgi:hypothetical protein